MESAKRSASATIVQVGFTQPPMGTTEEPVTKRFSCSNTLQLASTTPRPCSRARPRDWRRRNEDRQSPGVRAVLARPRLHSPQPGASILPFVLEPEARHTLAFESVDRPIYPTASSSGAMAFSDLVQTQASWRRPWILDDPRADLSGHGTLVRSRCADTIGLVTGTLPQHVAGDAEQMARQRNHRNHAPPTPSIHTLGHGV